MTEELAWDSDSEFERNDISVSPPSDIVAYNELRSCAELAQMAENGTLNLRPRFQRDVVWTAAEQTRFIDSLIKQLPIPSMCFAFDHSLDKWIVIDGLQRMASIINFLRGDSWRLSQLPDIDRQLSGKTASFFKNGKGNAKKKFNRVQAKLLPITVLRCKFSKRNHMEYVFTVFHRLNAGGIKLNNQEIRNCIFSGSFNDLLRDLDELPYWRNFNKMEDGNNYRLVYQEIMLRIFAFFEEMDKYTGQLGKFLNGYMHRMRNLDDNGIQQKRRLFERTTGVVERMFPRGPERRLPTAHVEAIFVGIMKNISAAEGLDRQELQERFYTLQNERPFKDEGSAEGFPNNKEISARFNLSIKAFSS